MANIKIKREQLKEGTELKYKNPANIRFSVIVKRIQKADKAYSGRTYTKYYLVQKHPNGTVMEAGNYYTLNRINREYYLP